MLEVARAEAQGSQLPASMELTIMHLTIPISSIFRRILTSLSLEDHLELTGRVSLEETSMLSPKEILARRAKRRRVESVSTSSSTKINKDPKMAEAFSPAPTTELDANPSHLTVSTLPTIPGDADYYAEALKVVLIV